MAASYVTRESAKKLESMGLDLDVYESLVTVTCLRNALEAMEAIHEGFDNAWDEFLWTERSFGGYTHTFIHTLTDAEAMAGAVIEYMEWRAKE